MAVMGAGLAGSAAADPSLSLSNVSASSCSLEVGIVMSTDDSTITSSHITINYHSSEAAFDHVELGDDAITAGYLSSDLDVNDTGPTMPFPVTPSSFDRHVLVQLIDRDQTPNSVNDSGIDWLRLHFVATTPGGSVTLGFDTTDQQGRHPTFLTILNGDDITADDIVFSVDLTIPVDPISISGCADYAVSGEDIPNVEVTMTQGSFTDDENTGTPPPCAGYEITGFTNGLVFCETNLDTRMDDEEAVSGGDANRMYQLATGGMPTPHELIMGDVVTPFDGTITVTDATAVAKWLIYLEDMSNQTGTWTFRLDDGVVTPPSPDTLTTRLENCFDGVVDLTGYFRGDVDFSWPNRNNKTLAGMDFALDAAHAGGDAWDVRLQVEIGAQGLETLVYSLAYDAAQWTLEGVENAPELAEFVTMENATNAGRVHGVVLGTGRRLERSGTLATFHFRAHTPDAAGRFAMTRLSANDVRAGALPEVAVGGGDTPAAPRPYALGSAPNPFNPSARIEYSVAPRAGSVPVVLRVHDLAGRTVRTLVDEQRTAGTYHVVWDGKAADGRAAGAGIYIVRMQAGDWTGVHKMALVK